MPDEFTGGETRDPGADDELLIDRLSRRVASAVVAALERQAPLGSGADLDELSFAVASRLADAVAAALSPALGALRPLEPGDIATKLADELAPLLRGLEPEPSPSVPAIAQAVRAALPPVAVPPSASEVARAVVAALPEPPPPGPSSEELAAAVAGAVPAAPTPPSAEEVAAAVRAVLPVPRVPPSVGEIAEAVRAVLPEPAPPVKLPRVPSAEEVAAAVVARLPEPPAPVLPPSVQEVATAVRAVLPPVAVPPSAEQVARAVAEVVAGAVPTAPEPPSASEVAAEVLGRLPEAAVPPSASEVAAEVLGRLPEPVEPPALPRVPSAEEVAAAVLARLPGVPAFPSLGEITAAVRAALPEPPSPVSAEELAGALVERLPPQLSTQDITEALLASLEAAVPSEQPEPGELDVVEAISSRLSQELAALRRDARQDEAEIAAQLADLRGAIDRVAVQMDKPTAGLAALDGALAAMPRLPATVDELRRMLLLLSEQVRDLARSLAASSEERIVHERRSRVALDRLQAEVTQRLDVLDGTRPGSFPVGAAEPDGESRGTA